jgi:hypothetical protein
MLPECWQFWHHCSPDDRVALQVFCRSWWISGAPCRTVPQRTHAEVTTKIDHSLHEGSAADAASPIFDTTSKLRDGNSAH